MVTEERGIAVVWVDPMTGCIYLKSPIDFVMVLNMKLKRGNVILKNNFSHKKCNAISMEIKNNTNDLGEIQPNRTWLC